MRAFDIRTTVIEGSLAFQMRRAAAARANECGLQIMTLPQLAARLAGGFTVPVSTDQLDLAIQRALDDGDFVELESVRTLPGMTRAVAGSLRKVWNADVELLETNGPGKLRIGELALIEGRVRNHLPKAMLIPRDLRDAAIRRIEHGPRLIGPVTIDGLSFIPPVWRPLIMALQQAVSVEWRAPLKADTSWFTGSLTVGGPARPLNSPAAISCADPRHEVVEALRWARRLITSGRARPSEIAMASANTAPWDDHVFALAKDAGLRVHFVQGIPALATRDGQRCAALADVLQHGLNQQRVRRLVSLCRGTGVPLDVLPDRWLSSLPRGATLVEVEEWRRAISAAVLKDGSIVGAEAVLPLLDLLSKGIAASNEAAILFLRGRALQIWEAAARSAPVDAIELSLRGIRLASETDAADSVAWCPARDLAAAPRPYVRLLGLTNRGWPRRTGDDPLLPGHVLSADQFDADPISRADRRHFEVILDAATGDVVLSRSRRSAQGSRVGRSPLLQNYSEIPLSRARIPESAFSESDRLVARPGDAARVPRIKSAQLCWRNWHVDNLTPHDGQFSADHPIVVRAIDRVQSATSLRQLLRDPLGFVWRYGLGWHTPQERERSLSIAPEDFGKLVHDLLRRAVDSLEPDPGYARASEEAIEEALRAAVKAVHEDWPLERPVPPKLLWSNTVDFAATLASVGLRRKDIAEVGTRSWTEVPFGQPAGFVAGRELPWDATTPVTVPNTPIRLRGTIDRLDLRSAPSAVRVTDYKTSEPPKNAARIVIGGGTELQRALYGLACRQLLEGEPRIIARLLYLVGEPQALRLDDLDAAVEQIASFINEAIAMLRKGLTVPGRLSFEQSNDLRLALPASPAYERRKLVVFDKAGKGVSRYWSVP
jgi:hypothetical protein